MSKKWSSSKVKSVERWLRQRWPELFTPGPDLKPLSLKIHKEILKYRDENPEISTRTLQEALKRHTASFGYLYGLIKNKNRYNLEGEAVEPIAAQQKQFARASLRARQKLAQKTRRQLVKNGNRVTVRSGAAVSKTNGNLRTAGAVKGPRIAYKPSRSVAARPTDSGARLGELSAASARKAPVIKYKQPRRKLQLQRRASEELSVATS